MTAKRFVHGGTVYEAPQGGGQWLDFSANINPLGLPHTALAAIESHIADVVHYPDPEARELRAALAAHYETPEDTLILGNGAAELFYLFFETYRPKRVLLPVPSFSEYERAALASGADVEYYLLKEKSGFAVDVEALLAEAERTQAEAVVLGNPNNPTGTLIPTDALVHLSERLTAIGCALVVDESFLDFRTDEQRFTLRKHAGKLPHLLLVRSLTKFFALPGLRLGFGIALPALVKKLDAHKDVWNVNVLAQAAGVAVLGDRDYQETTRRYLLEAGRPPRPAAVRELRLRAAEKRGRREPHHHRSQKTRHPRPRLRELPRPRARLPAAGRQKTGRQPKTLPSMERSLCGVLRDEIRHS